MEKEFIPYEQALELKELGFDEECLNKFYTKPNSKMFCVDEKERPYPIKNITKKLYTIGEHFVLKDDNVIQAPLYQQAFRWFREKHDIHSWIINADDNPNVFKPFFRSNGKFIFDQYLIDFYDTYEEAELECLKKLIEIVKNK